MPIQLELMPEEEKILEAPPPKTLVVRYGYLKEIGEFHSDLSSKVGCGTKLVVRTDRGTELAEMLTTTCGNGGCNKSITRDKMLEYIEKSGGRDYPFTSSGRILRVATTQDLAEQSKLDENKRKHVNLARELVTRHQLPMKVVEVEHLLGGERVLFYFTSEQRVDFRTLVRDLAHELHTRIELRQVGARDEARLIADYEKCGQHCCCKQFLKVLTPISMRAAKVQKATLDPTKISGRCGRLMCCLRYEDQTYEELRKKLPRRNTRVRTEKGDAWVIDGQILTQLVLCQYDDGKREAVPMEKILEFDRPKPLNADGRIMQTPNDFPRVPAGEGVEPRGRGPRNQQRPKPGAPAQPATGDPLAKQGPTGGDLNTAPADDLDDLIADANDGVPPTTPAAPVAEAPQTEVDERAIDPNIPPAAPGPQQSQPPQQQPPRGPQFQRGPRPQQGQQNRGGQNQQRFPKGPQRFAPPKGGPRGPQGFRPPQRQNPQQGSGPQNQPNQPQANIQPPAPPSEQQPPAPPPPQAPTENPPPSQ